MTGQFYGPLTLMFYFSCSLLFFLQRNLPPVGDLFQDLQDGNHLLTLLEILTGKEYVRMVYGVWTLPTPHSIIVIIIFPLFFPYLETRERENARPPFK